MEQVVDTLAHFVLEGTLLDKKNGVPIVYATVGVEGTSIGSITNQAGEFRLHLADSLRRKSLVFSHVGYVAQKIDITFAHIEQEVALYSIADCRAAFYIDVGTKNFPFTGSGNSCGTSYPTYAGDVGEAYDKLFSETGVFHYFLSGGGSV